MVRNKLSAHGTIFLLLLFLILFTLPSLACGSSDSTLEIYTNWETNEPKTLGHLSIIGLPRVMEYGKTYKVDFQLTVEIMEQGIYSVGFQSINWTIETGEPIEVIPIGFSGVYARQYPENESIEKSVHLFLPNQVQKKEGNLTLVADVIVYYSETSEVVKFIAPPVLIGLKTTSNLTLDQTALQVEKGNDITVNGMLFPSISGTYINLHYYRPNNTRIDRVTITDENGYFSDKIAPDVEGTWKVIANWTENDYTSAVTSNEISFKVEPRSPNILIIAIIIFIVLILVYSARYFRYFRKSQEQK